MGVIERDGGALNGGEYITRITKGGKDKTCSRDSDQTSLAGVQSSCQGTTDDENGKLHGAKLWRVLNVNASQGLLISPQAAGSQRRFSEQGGNIKTFQEN